MELNAAIPVSQIDADLQLQGSRMDPLRVFEATGAFIGMIGAGLIGALISVVMLTLLHLVEGKWSHNRTLDQREEEQ